MMLLAPSSTSLSSSSSSCNAALIRKECRLFGASRLTISIRRQNDAVSCEAADSSSASSWTAPIVAETKEKDAGGGVGKSAAYRLRQGSLTEDGLSYKEKFIVRCYEVGTNKTATVETIANLLQEVACNHPQSLGFSTDGFGTTTTMRKLHLIWATARMHIEIYKYPAWSDVVEVESWFESKGEIGIRRDWILKDYATQEVLGRATSKFVMMNQHTRRLEKVSDDVRKEYLGFCPRKPRLAFPEEKNGSLKKIAKLEDAAQYSRQGLVPRRADLDMNQHVNNVAYIGWFLESMPQEIIDNHELETITLDYKRECQQHDVIDSHTSPEPVEDTKVSELNGSNGTAAAAAEGKEDYCQFLHLLRLSGDGLEINRGRTEWRKKPTRDANHSV
ncbi:oleoyl-acyl carrier protein thioesterase, chloroplastic-like isoform X2 [Rhododendron vialii]|uniref:oleoyl-acyl carrier protein thioesterase, chloroplastic-like isoform X2 n=1 Tax=Rhododendron vialii TaxID=182163 RepID=UPI00265FA365|nr:oleoyl-acyl carrier protein thioesterase, chloroplastic-like isoform X2 [Rhododendron vialii]